MTLAARLWQDNRDLAGAGQQNSSFQGILDGNLHRHAMRCELDFFQCAWEADGD